MNTEMIHGACMFTLQSTVRVYVCPLHGVVLLYSSSIPRGQLVGMYFNSTEMIHC